MDWNDTIGQCVEANLIISALNHKPDLDQTKLSESIHRLKYVGVTRKAIADVLYGEAETLAGLVTLGDAYPLDFIAGMVCAADLVANGTHVTDLA